MRKIREKTMSASPRSVYLKTASPAFVRPNPPAGGASSAAAAAGDVVRLTAPLLSYEIDSCRGEPDDFLRERRVVKVLRKSLAVLERPAEELDRRRLLRLLLRVAVDEEPRKSGDRVGRVAPGVRDRDAEIGRHVRRGAGRRS